MRWSASLAVTPPSTASVPTNRHPSLAAAAAAAAP